MEEAFSSVNAYLATDDWLKDLKVQKFDAKETFSHLHMVKLVPEELLVDLECFSNVVESGNNFINNADFNKGVCYQVHICRAIVDVFVHSKKDVFGSISNGVTKAMQQVIGKYHSLHYEFFFLLLWLTFEQCILPRSVKAMLVQVQKSLLIRSTRMFVLFILLLGEFQKVVLIDSIFSF